MYPKNAQIFEAESGENLTRSKMTSCDYANEDMGSTYGNVW